MFSIINNTENKNNHKVIIRFLKRDLLKHKNIDMPKDLKIVIYDYIYDNFLDDNLTSMTKNKITKEYIIHLNLKQLLFLYKNNTMVKKRGLPRLKRFSIYLLHALYHELGHYNLKHFYIKKEYLNNIQKRNKEIDADKFSLKILGIKVYRQLEFNFVNNL